MTSWWFFEKLNNRPRKVLNYQIPAKIMREHLLNPAKYCGLIVMHLEVESKF